MWSDQRPVETAGNEVAIFHPGPPRGPHGLAAASGDDRFEVGFAAAGIVDRPVVPVSVLFEL